MGVSSKKPSFPPLNLPKDRYEWIETLAGTPFALGLIVLVGLMSNDLGVFIVTAGIIGASTGLGAREFAARWRSRDEATGRKRDR